MEQCRHFAVVACVVFFSSLIHAQDYPQAIDLFRATGLLDNPLPRDVTKKTYNGRVSFHFGSQVPGLIAANVFSDANKLIHDSHDFQVSASAKIDGVAKQSPQNTLVSISSKDGKKLYFRVALSGEDPGNNLKIKYAVQTKTSDTIQKQFKCPRTILFNAWNKIVVRFQDEENLIRIYVNDNLIGAETFKGGIAAFPSDAQLRLAQSYEIFQEAQPSIEKRFRGELQDVKLERGPECKGAPRPCKCLPSGLKSCVMDGNVRKEDERWNRDNCTNCRCTDGQVICMYTCTPCKDGDNVYFSGDTYKSGCKDCVCGDDGKAVCSPPKCPQLDCSGKSGDTVTLPGQCCPICKEDQCIGTGKVYKTCGSTCPKTCQNFQTQVSCSGNKCTEGCFCADDQVLRNGVCVYPSQCTCTHNGKTIQPGSVVSSSCEFCVCVLGTMHCSRFCR